MANNTIPLAVPDDLLGDLKSAATDTHLSMADVMRQTMKLGLPRLREQLSVTDKLKPFSKEEARRAFAPDPEWDRLEASLAKHASRHLPEPEAH